MAAGAALVVPVFVPLADEVAEEEAARDEEEADGDGDDAPLVLLALVLLAPDEGDDPVVALGTAPSVSLSRPATSVTAWSSVLYPVMTPTFEVRVCVSLSDCVSEIVQLASNLDGVRVQAAVNAL